MAEYLAVSTAVTDRIHDADGSFKGDYLGGAGIYAFSGMRLWSPSVNLVAGVGADFVEKYRRWLDAALEEPPFLSIKDSCSAVSLVRYHRNGEREEIPLYGPEHYAKLEATPEEISVAVSRSSVRGVYIFKGTDQAYWEAVLAIKRKAGFSLCWEINASYAVMEQEQKVRLLAQKCEMFSINRTEGMSLFGVDDEDEVIGRLRSWNLPIVYFRVGARGAWLITPDTVTFSPSCKNIRVVDATGAGNSSTAGVFLNRCEGVSLAECGRRGALSAACCIKQFGPPQKFELLDDREVFCHEKK